MEWISNPSLPSVLDLSWRVLLSSYFLLPLFSPLLLTVTLPAHIFLQLRLQAGLTEMPKAQGHVLTLSAVRRKRDIFKLILCP